MFNKIVCIFFLILFMGCNNTGTDNATTKLTIGVTDAPIDTAEEVNITFTKIEIASGTEDSEGWITYFEGSQSINLLDFQNGSIFNFPRTELVLGEYGQIRIFLGSETDDNTIVIDSVTHELVYNSGVANNGLKLVGGFTLEDGVDTSLTIDFDVRKSIVVKGGIINPTYNLKPTIKLIQESLTGNILISNAESGTTYYLYGSEESVTGEELTTNENGDLVPYLNAVLSAISFTETELNYVKLAFVPFGTYKIYKGTYTDGVADPLVQINIVGNDTETVSISSADESEVNYTF